MVAALPSDVSLFSHGFCSRCRLPVASNHGAVEGDADAAAVACAQCGGADCVAHRWGFLLCLEDATGLLAAAVWGDEAALLLGGLSADDLRRSGLTRSALVERLSALQSAHRWLDACIAAFPATAAPPPAPHAASAAFSASPAFSATDDLATLLSEADDDSGDDRGGGTAAATALSGARCFRLVHTAARAHQ